MRPGTRLLTLAGAGGAGKTRLAVELATSWQGHYRDGCCFVDLSQLDRAGGVAELAARALGLVAESGRDPSSQVAEWARSRSALIVLDNCEHLLDEVAEEAARWLGEAPQLFILATSREPLAVPAESVLRIPPLELAAAVDLFGQRAAAAAGTGAAAADPTTVRELCRRLDGIPLALELAAAQLRSMSAADLLEGIDRRFELLGSSLRGVPARHRTLEAVVTSSWELLGERERAVCARLSVLTGTFSLETARAVGGPQTAAALPRLVDTSLIDRLASAYRMSETVRDYGRRRLELSGEAAAVLLRAAREADARQAHRSALPLLTRALESMPGGDPRELEALDLLAKAAERTAQYERGLEALGRMRHLVEASGDAPARAQLAVRTGSFITLATGDLDAARSSLEEARNIYRQAADPRALAAENELAWIAGLTGDLAAQVASARPVVEAVTAGGDQELLMHALGCLGDGLLFQGRLAEAGHVLGRGLELATKGGEVYQWGWFTAALAMGRSLAGEPAIAVRMLAEARERVHENVDAVMVEAQLFAHHLLGNHRALLEAFEADADAISAFGIRGGWAIDLAAVAAAETGDPAHARRLLERSGSLYQGRELYYQSRAHLWHRGQVAWAAGDQAEAVRWIAAGAAALVAAHALPHAVLTLRDLVDVQRAAGDLAGVAAAGAQLQGLLASFESDGLAVLAAPDHAEAAAARGRRGLRRRPARELALAGRLEEAADAYEVCAEFWRRDQALSRLALRGGAASPGARILRRSVAFAGLPDSELEELAQGAVTLRHPAGGVIHRRFDTAGSIEVVSQGSVRLVAGGETVAEAGPGDIIGERSLLDAATHATDVEAITGAELLRLDAPSVLRFAEARPAVAERLATLLRQRLRQEASVAGELEPADVPARLLESMNRLSRAEGRTPPLYEILPLYLDGSRPGLLRPAGLPSWKVATTAATPGEAVGDQLAERDLAADIVHSTSWRYEDGRLVLTYLAVLGPSPAVPAGFEAVSVGRADLARGSAHDAPSAIDVAQVVEHGLRHLSWLSRDDEVIRTALTQGWLALVAGYVPEPFRAL